MRKKKEINFFTSLYVSNKNSVKTFLKYFINIFPKGTC